jgi:N6-adenosine-specific RNA methylase IME4
MTVEEIAHLTVPAEPDAHLFLWTTHRYLDAAFDVARAWGFRYSATLTWCKEPVGVGPGGLFAVTSEFVIYARRGSPERHERIETSWWRWPRSGHSVKPDAFMDMVERAVPGPYLELFARRQRLGWDTWGNEALEHVEVVA